MGKAKERFHVSEFQNASGTTSFRVHGYFPDGRRVRKNYARHEVALAEKHRLELEGINEERSRVPRYTSLTDEQLKDAEAALHALDGQSSLSDCVKFYRENYRDVIRVPLERAASEFAESIRTEGLRDETLRNLVDRVSRFAHMFNDRTVASVGTSEVGRFLGYKEKSHQTKINDRLALSRFFNWAKDPARSYLAENPCEALKLRKPDAELPAVLSLDQCRALMEAVKAYRGGLMAPYIAIALFAGVRPKEIGRLRWEAVRFDDGEILVEAKASKVRRVRHVGMEPNLVAWLQAFRDQPIAPCNLRRNFDAVRALAGIEDWPHDVMRHTAITHYFRKYESFGRTAEWAGNSEQVIKDRYKGRVTMADTKQFWEITP